MNSSSSSVVTFFMSLTLIHLPFLIIVDSPGDAKENLEIPPDNVFQTSPLHDAFGPCPFSISDHSSHSVRYSSSSGTSVEASEHGLASTFLFIFPTINVTFSMDIVIIDYVIQVKICTCTCDGQGDFVLQYFTNTCIGFLRL